MGNKNIVFDVVGTLVGYEKLYEVIESRLGSKMRAQGIGPTAMFGYMWIEVAEREYTYLSMSGAYVPYVQVFESIFWRMLWKAGILEPRKFATSEDLGAIMEEGYKKMEMRPGAKECVQKLREAGFTVWAFTMGDLSRVSGYFTQAGIDMPAENLKSCDSSKIGKPDPEAYRPLLKQLSGDGSLPWFAAAHMWDVSAARRTGYAHTYYIHSLQIRKLIDKSRFRGAYCSVWENEALTDLFGDMDVLSDTLPEMADKVIASTP
ncbi:hypothetical protein D0867_00309 [Hortaea werneckii]|uniref:Haloacid dehalogenase-like hydrolase n=2 Tax=Hortaea werneckii TaxID=91943 RepID=A0A3M7AF47_HORWE|nr:hypothetical protein D0867_00309 [Hortaea werneckii]